MKKWSYCLIIFLAISCGASKTYRKSGLTSFPDSVCRMRSLENLYLGPKSVTVYPPLSAVIKGQNQIKLVPDCLCELERLKRIDLSASGIHQLPNCLGKLTNLSYLNVALNPNFSVSDFLPILLDMVSLEELGIGGTRYTSTDSVALKKRFPNLTIHTF